jgi:hypothetical protein
MAFCLDGILQFAGRSEIHSGLGLTVENTGERVAAKLA